MVATFIPVLLIGELRSERFVELVSGGARREPIRSFIQCTFAECMKGTGRSSKRHTLL